MTIKRSNSKKKQYTLNNVGNKTITGYRLVAKTADDDDLSLQ